MSMRFPVGFGLRLSRLARGKSLTCRAPDGTAGAKSNSKFERSQRWCVGYGVKIEESARRKTYSAVTHCETACPVFIAGLNSILQAARIALSVSPAGSPFITRTRATFPRAESKTFKVTNPCTPLRRASVVYEGFGFADRVARTSDSFAETTISYSSSGSISLARLPSSVQR